MEEKSPGLDSLKIHVKEYINTRIDIAVLKATEKGSHIVSNAALYVAVFFVSVFFLLLLTIGLSLLISDAIGNSWSGFLIMAGVYLLIGVLLWVMRDKWIRKPVVNIFIRSVLGKGMGPWI